VICGTYLGRWASPIQNRIFQVIAEFSFSSLPLLSSFSCLQTIQTLIHPLIPPYRLFDRLIEMPAPTPTLLGLPVELRCKIITYVISNLMDESTSPPGWTRRRRRRVALHDFNSITQEYYPGWPSKEYVLYLRTTNSKTFIPPILRVNPSLYHETMDCIFRYPQKFVYKLDMMLVDEQELWPTWRCVPQLTTRVEKLKI